MMKKKEISRTKKGCMRNGKRIKKKKEWKKENNADIQLNMFFMNHKKNRSIEQRERENNCSYLGLRGGPPLVSLTIESFCFI